MRGICGQRSTNRAITLAFVDSPLPDGWIGVDLNTTGYIAVVAHPASGGVVMLGRQQKDAGTHSNVGKRRNQKAIRDHESSVRCDLNRRIVKEIVKMARQLQCGIKLEDLSGAGHAGRQKPGVPLPFSRRDGSLYHLQNLLEARAHDAGVPFALVNPAFTSRCCNRCGGRGIRRGKRFYCPHCGYNDHADVNAAFNIAAAAPGTDCA